MSDMPTKEVLNFSKPEEIKNTPVRVDGTSALKLEPEFSDDVEVDKDRDAQIGEIRKFIKPEETQNILPLTNTDAGVQRAPRGVVGPVGNQGRETNGGDRTGGRKKGLGFRITAGVMAGVAAAGIGYGVFKGGRVEEW